MRRMLDLGDFENFISPSQVYISPDGSRVIATFTKPVVKENSYKSWVEVYDLYSGERVYVSRGFRDVSGRWSLDGRRFYFLRVSDEGVSQLVEVSAGVEKTLLAIDKPVIDYRICGSGVGFFLLREFVEKPDEDYVYSEDIRIWFDAIGFTAGSRTRLYKVYLDSGFSESLEIFSGDVVAFDVDPRCSSVVAAVSEDRMRPIMSRLYEYILGEDRLRLLSEEEYVVEGVSTNGVLLAASAHKMERGFASHLKLLVIDMFSARRVLYEAPLGMGLGRRVYSDVRGPNTSMPKPRVDGERVLFPLSIGGRYCLYSWSRDKGFEEVLCGDFTIEEFDSSRDKIVYVMSSATKPPELYLYDLGVREVKNLTSYNKWLEEFKLAEPERFSFIASDGVEIEGWIIPPLTDRLRSNGRYPAILQIHGGPKSKYGYAFMFEHHLMSSKGFYVIYMNPRGSDGYTEDFADIRLRYGERDYRDIIEGLDYVLKLKPDIDPGRIGVTGISYGGFMTNWIITHTDRFRAAVSQNGISMWLTEYGVTDIGFYFVPDQIGGTPFSRRELLDEKSPIYYAESVKTPVLFIHSMNDYRCYIDQSIAMHTTLRHLEKTSAIALFREGSHTFGWNGRPRSRYKRYKLILEWFERYLK
ncbi:MAG: S9 family peptidase [Sulfolobales archaeon]